MLERLGWQSLRLRRQAARLTMLYKIINNLVNVEKDNLIELPQRERRGNSQQFCRLASHKQDYRQFSFFPRTIREWNELPEDIVCASSVESFKNRVSAYLVALELAELQA